MSYMIRKAEKGDLPRIYEIYETWPQQLPKGFRVKQDAG